MGRILNYKCRQLYSILFILICSNEILAFNAHPSSFSKLENSSLEWVETCMPLYLQPDIDLVPSNAEIDLEIKSAVDKFRDTFLGGPPSQSQLEIAVGNYEDFNIKVENGIISGKTPKSLEELKFLKVLARHLKANPSDSEISTMFNNLVWWASKEICDGNVDADQRGYDFRHFGRPTILMRDYLSEEVQQLFIYSLQQSSENFLHFWTSVYDVDHQIEKDAINTDHIYNRGDILLAFVLWQDNADERYRYMKAFKRYMERFFSYSSGTANGIKKDGSGYHHWTAYNNYMYSYNTAAALVHYLDGTRFQVAKENYLIFRDAVLIQYLQANDDLVQALGTCGRKPNDRAVKMSQSSLKLLANAGGNILGLETADPILAGLYNRIYGIDKSFNTDYVAPFGSGFVQQNYASQGFYRQDSWLAVSKGFSDGLWGTETYPGNNRYGRYQSYGSLEIIYPGEGGSGNGFNMDSWNWNYIPGATTIILPWEKLHAERGRIDELQQKSFVGSLIYNKKNEEYLQNTMGQFGMFAMDFREKIGQGFGTIHSGENHNSSFTFKKSNFFFNDLIICLGSGISNNDSEHSTVTTLYQRMDNLGLPPIANTTDFSGAGLVELDGGETNWVLSNYGTGFYVMADSHTLKLNKILQQTPNHNQIWPISLAENISDVYYSAYIDHGKNPDNEGYEYVILPNSTIEELGELHKDVSTGQKPYTVHLKNQEAHILEHHGQNIMAFAFFSKMSNIDLGFIQSVNEPCLIMSHFDSLAGILNMSVVNPVLGLLSRSYTPALSKYIEITLQGEWETLEGSDDIKIISSSKEASIIQFLLKDGLPQIVKLQKLLVSSIPLLKNPDVIKVYPSPTNDFIKISSEYPLKKVQLFDVMGREMFATTYDELNTIRTIDFNGYEHGIFFMKITIDKGTTTKKILYEPK